MQLQFRHRPEFLKLNPSTTNPEVELSRLRLHPKPMQPCLQTHLLPTARPPRLPHSVVWALSSERRCLTDSPSAPCEPSSPAATGKRLVAASHTATNRTD